MRLLTEILTKDDLGSYYLILSTMSIFTMFLINPFNLYAQKEAYKIDQDMKMKSFLNIYFLYMILATFVSYIIIYFYVKLFP